MCPWPQVFRVGWIGVLKDAETGDGLPPGRAAGGRGACPDTDTATGCFCVTAPAVSFGTITSASSSPYFSTNVPWPCSSSSVRSGDVPACPLVEADRTRPGTAEHLGGCALPVRTPDG
ncbi:hypothetical protein GCM10010393_31170 [Streptomyces gobitricini]|uniref:Uncharacterized protein n=1 Tax=Streptomyces gobitricini TaxID=68211 RepID=A0ABN3M8Y6_9ACTN